MELHVISYPDIFSNELKAIESVMACGSVILHLRKPELSSQEYTALFQSIPEQLYPRIVLHSCYHLAQKHSVYGLHFSTSKREQAELHKHHNKGTSCHSINEISTQSSDFDYCFLSPIFPSISKKGYAGDFNKDHLREFLSQRRGIKIIALGGISLDKIDSVHQFGFNGMAVLGTVWGDNPENINDFKSTLVKLQEGISLSTKKTKTEES